MIKTRHMRYFAKKARNLTKRNEILVENEKQSKK